jgi:hypothetical protein
MRDEKMLEKLATHDVKDAVELFTRTTEGHVWHSQPTPEEEKAGKLKADVVAQSSGKNNNRTKKKFNNNNKPLAGAPTVAAVAVAAGGGHSPCSDKRLCQPTGSDEGGPRCPVHNSRCHSAKEC